MKWHWIRLEETSSTQIVAKQLAEEDPGQHRIVIARRQNSGKGRRGNSWQSPEGGLWCTLSIPLKGPADPFLNLLLALAVQEGVSALLKEPAGLSIKWPNDLLARGQKWGGILSEVISAGNGQEVLMGLGLNLQISAADLQKETELPSDATSIMAEFGQSPSPEESLESILSVFEEILKEDSTLGGRSRNRLRIASHLDTIGRSIIWKDLQGNIGEGEAVSIAEDGALIVEIDSAGSKHMLELRSGEVHHVRPANDGSMPS